eukprot:s5637_g2.t2
MQGLVVPRKPRWSERDLCDEDRQVDPGSPGGHFLGNSQKAIHLVSEIPLAGQASLLHYINHWNLSVKAERETIGGRSEVAASNQWEISSKGAFEDDLCPCEWRLKEAGPDARGVQFLARFEHHPQELCILDTFKVRRKPRWSERDLRDEDRRVDPGSPGGHFLGNCKKLIHPMNDFSDTGVFVCFGNHPGLSEPWSTRSGSLQREVATSQGAFEDDTMISSPRSRSPR